MKRSNDCEGKGETLLEKLVKTREGATFDDKVRGGQAYDIVIS